MVDKKYYGEGGLFRPPVTVIGDLDLIDQSEGIRLDDGNGKDISITFIGYEYNHENPKYGEEWNADVYLREHAITKPTTITGDLLQYLSYDEKCYKGYISYEFDVFERTNGIFTKKEDYFLHVVKSVATGEYFGSMSIYMTMAEYRKIKIERLKDFL
jgi:hypothetical protein